MMSFQGRTTAACMLAMFLFVACGTKKKEVGPAPANFRVQFGTTKGNFVVLVNRDWSPRGADRFYELVKMHFYDGNYFFRVVPSFVVQWGINGDPSVAKSWDSLTIKDDPPKESNKAGTITFATSGSDSRTTQVFINLNNNGMLDSQGFSPFGEVAEGMSVVQNLYAGYGDGPPQGRGPDQKAITDIGNAYLEEHFPRLDHITKTQIIE
jgi:peptidyl-prolyl cis-trans isomerase A (cyclophilin A)